MKEYLLISIDEIKNVPLSEIVNQYNEAITTIWHKDRIIDKLKEENEMLYKAYEDVSNELYG